MRFSYRNRANRSIGFCDIQIIPIFEGYQYTLVIVTEDTDNTGMSICNAFEDLFRQVCQVFQLNSEKVIWIEHWERDRVPELSQKNVINQSEWNLVNFELNKNKEPYNPRWVYLGSSLPSFKTIVKKYENKIK